MIGFLVVTLLAAASGAVVARIAASGVCAHPRAELAMSAGAKPLDLACCAGLPHASGPGGRISLACADGSDDSAVAVLDPPPAAAPPLTLPPSPEPSLGWWPWFLAVLGTGLVGTGANMLADGGDGGGLDGGGPSSGGCSAPAPLPGGESRTLYHGSQNFEGGAFDLSRAIELTRGITGTPGIYLTDDATRAIQQLAGPSGTVVRTEVPSDFADEIRQCDPFGRTEYFVVDQAGTQILNDGVTDVVSSIEAIKLWAAGGF
ncbi:MAG: hypothetical protein ACRD0D_04795 [Acidimicrobiales bacterium]